MDSTTTLYPGRASRLRTLLALRATDLSSNDIQALGDMSALRQLTSLNLHDNAIKRLHLAPRRLPARGYASNARSPPLCTVDLAADHGLQ